MAIYRNLAVAGSLMFFCTGAAAEFDCEVEITETLNVNMQDIQLAKIEVAWDHLTLEGIDGTEATIDVRKCASSQERLDKMEFLARRDGETMVFELDSGGSSSYSRGWFGRGGSNYGRFEINARLPAQLATEVKVSSGKASIRNFASVNSQVSSGQLVIRNIEDKVSTRVSSGSVEVAQVGPLYVSSIGSGQVRAEQVNGDIRVNTIGSGQLRVSEAGGDLSIGSVGSGSARVANLSGSAKVDRVGSGSVRLEDVNSDVNLGSIGSGSIRVNRAGGDVTLDKKGSGSFTTSDVHGQVRQPGDNRQK